MPRRTDLKKILIIGSGPIIIGQGCEFDYSGVQACKALKAEGYSVVLVNSNPATIMTDPQMADATYIEPITWQAVAKIIAIEKPHALLSTMGGQTALNCALDLERYGVLAENNVELIGANKVAIDKAEDRELFRAAMQRIGLAMAKSSLAHSLEEAQQQQPQIGFPVIIRPSYTLGGSGGGIAHNKVEFEEICRRGLAASPTSEILIEESLIGWKEFELEVVRDKNDSCIVVCTIENLDPMGIHTGDSITVAPAQTLTDYEYQQLRDAAFAVLREIGVETGGANVQFAVNPANGKIVVIEMNPRVSRSSALASKATGFPIAKIAALLAVGYTLDELQNDMTGGLTPAAFEPSIDYTVVKIPRFNFDKFPQANSRLTTQMKAIGEVMAIGVTFAAAIQKAFASLELGFAGFDSQVDLNSTRALDKVKYELVNPGPMRCLYLADALRLGLTCDQIFNLTKIDPWFIAQIAKVVATEQQIIAAGVKHIDAKVLAELKTSGYSDRRLAQLLRLSENTIRAWRHSIGITAKFRRIDSCAAEFPATTAYMYSCYEGDCEAASNNRQTKIVVLGSGPNRIGQGVEFDYCCVQAVQALRAHNIEAIMVNCNPETVSTDYDTANKLYFEPLTLESVIEIVRCEQAQGVIIQFGGQTPLNLAKGLQHAGIAILGTSPQAIDTAEDRSQFLEIVTKLGLKQPENATVNTVAEGLQVAQNIGYPLMVRPSYVLGGQGMEVVYDDEELVTYLQNAVNTGTQAPILLDRFLEEAIEVDADAVCDQYGNVLVAGIMEHIEQAGIHSGDSAVSLPPYRLSPQIQTKIAGQMEALARELKVIGVINAQFAIQNDQVYVLEVNPRASRTIPFVSKAVGMPIAQIAVGCILGASLAELQATSLPRQHKLFAVKHSVFPFIKFPEVDPILGPEMRSTGEVMGFGASFAQAYAKSRKAVGVDGLPGDKFPAGLRRMAFVSVRDNDKMNVAELANKLINLGFDIMATAGTVEVLLAAGIKCQLVNKVTEGRPNIVDEIKNSRVDFIVNTTQGRQSIADSHLIRSSAVQQEISYTTTLSGAYAMVAAMDSAIAEQEKVYSLQEIHDTKVVDYEYEISNDDPGG